MKGQKNMSFNTMFLGGPANGKTYFLLKYSGQQQNPRTKITMGMDQRIANIRLNHSQNLTVKLWDSCGVETSDNLTRFCVKKIKIQHFIVFTDVTNSQDLYNIKRYVKIIEDSCPNKDQAKILILGNKIDLIDKVDRQMVQTIRKTYLQRPNFQFELISCKNDFKKAKNNVQNFLKKCYRQNYRLKVIPKIVDFIKRLESQSFDNQWFYDQKRREAVEKTFKQRSKQKKNMEESMILSLLFHICQRSIAIFDEERQQIHQQYTNERLSMMKNEMKFQKEKVEIIAQITQNLKKQQEKEMLRLRQQLMEYQYWIVEADRLHYSVSQAIANSPFKEKFIEFRRVAERVNSTFEEEMGLWQVHVNQQNHGSSFIESGVLEPTVSDNKRLWVQRRFALQQKVQKLQQLVDDCLPAL